MRSEESAATEAMATAPGAAAATPPPPAATTATAHPAGLQAAAALLRARRQAVSVAGQAPSRLQPPSSRASSEPAVQVTNERVVAPPERFLNVSDAALLQHFQQQLGGGRAADDLAALLRWVGREHGCCAALFMWLMFSGFKGSIPSLSQPPLAACWTASAPTSSWPCGAAWKPTLSSSPRRAAAAAGTRPPALPPVLAARCAACQASRPLVGAPGWHPCLVFPPPAPRHPTQIFPTSPPHHTTPSLPPLPPERRFLSDLSACLRSSHFRLLGSAEWEAASSEAFLFTLPVAVDWKALDKRMLQARPRGGWEAVVMLAGPVAWGRGAGTARGRQASTQPAAAHHHRHPRLPPSSATGGTALTSARTCPTCPTASSSFGGAGSRCAPAC